MPTHPPILNNQEYFNLGTKDIELLDNNDVRFENFQCPFDTLHKDDIGNSCFDQNRIKVGDSILGIRKNGSNDPFIING